jgi:hypothetical protein
MPGMGHCAGGPVPNSFGQNGNPGLGEGARKGHASGRIITDEFCRDDLIRRDAELDPIYERLEDVVLWVERIQ